MIGLLALLATALGLLVLLLTAVLAWKMTHPPRRSAAWAIARSLPSDPNDLGLSYQEWWLDRPGNVRLPVWEIATSADAQGDDGLTVVFVHGWGHGRVNSLQRIEPFLDRAQRIVLYDLCGHGDALGGASTLGHADVDDLLALLERLGEGPFVLVGHSMGAVIALNTAAKADDRGMKITGIIAYAPYLSFHNTLQGRLRGLGQPTRPLTDLALLFHRLRGVQPTGADISRIERLDMPLLVVHGVNDGVSPLDDARAIARASPNASLMEVTDAAHTDAHIVDVDGHDRAVRAFVERIRVRASHAP